jgi:C-terminal processing protease CtpA/Prc
MKLLAAGGLSIFTGLTLIILKRCSPLARPGVKIKEGDVVLSVNGVLTLSVKHPSLLLPTTAGENEFTASDGETFTEGFRNLGLGKVIGTRTWGGEIWLSSNNLLVDKGLASAAETGVYAPQFPNIRHTR